jgi:Family of unknown function (DUF5677)
MRRRRGWCVEEREEAPVMSANDLTKNIGAPEFLVEFVKTNEAFVKALPELRDLADRALSESRQDSLNDKLVVEFAAIAFEDFEEIVTLCANDSARGGLKILRAMFEHVVIVFEMDENNKEEAKHFADYYRIDQYKVAQEIRNEFPGKILSDEKFKEIEAKRNEVKDQYLIKCDDPKCKKCCKDRVNHSWTKVGIVQMAKKLGFKGVQVVGAYYAPLEETHPKMGAILHRVKVREGTIKPDDGKGTLVLAHLFVLETVRVLKERSNIKSIEELYTKCRTELKTIWGKDAEELEKEAE